MTFPRLRNPDAHRIVNWSKLKPSGIVGISDIDGCVERNGQFLILETKRPKESISRGQQRMLTALANIEQFTVVIVTLDMEGEEAQGWYDHHSPQRRGKGWQSLNRYVKLWWDRANSKSRT